MAVRNTHLQNTMTTYESIHSEWQRRATLLARETWLAAHGRSLAAQTVLAVDVDKFRDDLRRGRICRFEAVRLIASSRNLMHRSQTKRLLLALHDLVDNFR